MTQCQSLTRIYLAACEAAEAESAEKLRIEEDMCTKIAAAWKGYRCQVMYKSIVTGVCVSSVFAVSTSFRSITHVFVLVQL